MGKLKIPILVASLFITTVCLFLVADIVSHSVANQHRKLDYAEVNHIKYGLFSVNEWKRQLAGIIADEISKLDLSVSNQRELKKHVRIQLNGLIDQVERKIRESNKGSFKGWIKQAVINSVVDIEDIKEGIPVYADAIIAQMTSAGSEKALKGALNHRIKSYFDKTFENQNFSELDRILSRTGTADIEGARLHLDAEIARIQNSIFAKTWIVIGLSMLLFILTGVGKSPLSWPLYVMLILNLSVLLFAGITTPMIDMEAKISSMSFTLLDHPIRFTNQILYYQTKSILDVFWIMITHPDIEMKAVGILMVVFSVVFPVFKMLSTFFYFMNIRGAHGSRVVKFFVLKSGKWSMTDVLIVAIFMAYIGFNGIISSQFANFSTADQDLVLLATNGTSLQPGFYIFLTYTILALFLSDFLTRRSDSTVAVSRS